MSGTSDPLSGMVSAVSFQNLETDLATIGVALVGLAIVELGVKWIVKMVRHG